MASLARARWRLSSLLGLAILFCGAPGGTPPGLQVYMGFMDEEVKYVLEKLIREYPDREVIVLEREIKSEGMLFELPTAVYGQQPKRQKVADIPAGETFQGRWASELRKTMAREGKQLAAAVDPKFKAKTNVSGEPFEMLTFNAGAGGGKKPPVVLVRSPEMGLQPSLVPIYCRAVTDSLRALDEAKPESGGLQLSVFGTSGAIGSHLAPGALNRVNGSVYVGMEVVPPEKPGGKPRYRGVIRVVDNTGGAPRTFFESKPMDTRVEAETLAKNAFNGPGVGVLVDKAHSGVTLGTVLRGLQVDRGGSVSLTVSFFGGDEEKTSGRRLGLTNVNMEDYHVLSAFGDVLRDPSLGTVNVTRFNCDPPEIPEALVKAMEGWGLHTKYSADHYVDAILWGLQGSRSVNAPKSAGWNALDGIPNPDAFAFRMADGRILDPFYAEVGSDFLTAALKKELLGSSLFSKVFYEALSERERKSLDTLLAQKSELLAVMAKEIYRDFTTAFRGGTLTGEDTARLRAKILELVTATHSLDVPEGTPLHDAMKKALADTPEKLRYLTEEGKVRLLGRSNVPVEKGKAGEAEMEIWVRSGKWKGNVSMTLEHLLRELFLGELKDLPGPEKARRVRELFIGDVFARLDGANADRALYKTGLVGGMLQGSWEHVVRRRYFYELRDPAFFDRELERIRKKVSGLREAAGC